MAYTGIQTLQTSAFGDLQVETPSPIIQLQFPYGVLDPTQITTTTTGSGTVSAASVPFITCSTNSAANSTASAVSHRALHYNSGEGGLLMMTAVFTTGVAGSTQWIGLSNTNVDALFYGYSGTTFGINRIDNNTSYFIPQTSWNVDPMNGTGPSGMTLIPSNGNVYKIQYQWLGFGDISFFIENPITNLFQLVHTIQYPNANTVTSLRNPAMQIAVQANSTTATSNIVVRSPSMAAFVQGELSSLGNDFSIYSFQSISTTQYVVASLRNNTTFNGVANYKQATMTGLSYANGNQIAIVSVYLNGTISGSPTYSSVSTYSCCSAYLPAGGTKLTISGGTIIATYFVAANSTLDIPLTSLSFILEPGDTLSIAAIATAGGTNNLYGSFTWIEQF